MTLTRCPSPSRGRGVTPGFALRLSPKGRGEGCRSPRPRRRRLVHEEAVAAVGWRPPTNDAQQALAHVTDGHAAGRH